jgi:6-pyruvoyltetrahydropterin/6-carboxytetrahydropterin synthase
MSFVIHLQKESFKFSCSHFTVLSAKEAEHLHGHNYQVRVALKISALDPELGFAFDFNAVKPLIKELCDDLDEKILLPLKSPFVQVTHKQEQVSALFGARKYSFPLEDCRLLSISNVTSEELARWLCLRLIERIKHLPRIERVRVAIEETRGQSVSYIENIGPTENLR